MTQFYDFKIENIKDLSLEETNIRKKNLDLFYQNGFPNKKNEDWKFSDLREIVSKNFNKLDLKFNKSEKPEINFIKDFEHNYIVLINGELTLSNFEFEENNKITLKPLVNSDYLNKKEKNPLVNLNHALSDKGYLLEVKDNYKFKKILVI